MIESASPEEEADCEFKFNQSYQSVEKQSFSIGLRIDCAERPRVFHPRNISPINTHQRLELYVLHSANDLGRNLVGICVRRRTTILQPALPAILNCRHRNTDRRTAVRNAEAELVDRLSFMLASQTQMVVSTIHGDVFFDSRSEC